MYISNQSTACRRLILKLREVMRTGILLALLQGFSGMACAAPLQGAPAAPTPVMPASPVVPAVPAQLSPAVPVQTAAPIAAPVPAITITGASVSASGTINDDGAALTQPNMSLYRGQLAAMQKLQQDNQALQLEIERAQLEQSEKEAEPKPVRKIVKMPAPQPYLVNLTGVGDERRARVAIPGYGEITVQPDDVLPNRWRVLSIDDDGVVVQTNPGHRTQRIAYQTQMPASQTAPAPVRMTTHKRQPAVNAHPTMTAPRVTAVPLRTAVSAPQSTMPPASAPAIELPARPVSAPVAVSPSTAPIPPVIQPEAGLSLAVPVHRANREAAGDVGGHLDETGATVRRNAAVRRASQQHKPAKPARDARPAHVVKHAPGPQAGHKTKPKAHSAAPRKKSHCHFICQ